VSFFDRFKKDKFEDNTFLLREEKGAGWISGEQLMRWYLYDMAVVGKEDVAKKLELPPISKEGMEMEEADSEKRMARIDKYVMLASQLADINATIIEQLYSEELYESFEDLDEEARQEAIAMHKSMSEDATLFFGRIGFAAILSMLSTSFALGLVTEGTSQVEGIEHE
jgi:hypothetical protein